jgi:large subunit ribosomal protein L29
MKFSELKDKSVDQLRELIVTSRKELFNLRFQAASGESAAAARPRDVRRTVARAMTLLNQKKAK